MVINFITRDGDDDMNISYVNSNKTTSLPVELDALNNKISLMPKISFYT